MKFSEMKRAAHNWLADQKVWLSIMVNPESINCDVDIAEGFIDALHLLGIYSADQAKEAYGELRAAHDEAMKKTALSAANTESGKAKESCPTGDKSLAHIYSIAMTPGNVKCCNADLYNLIRSMQVSRVSDPEIVCTLLNMLRPQRSDAHAE